VSFTMIVLVKQVPNWSNIGVQAMNADGTVNRNALPAVFNPDDLLALELALDLKDRFGGHVTVLTMGPPRAADILRDALYRGADRAVLLSDRRFAASDTLATSYSLAQTIITRLSPFDLVICGRQAIDGDTAQVGPQVADKLRLPQVTYVECVLDCRQERLTIRRNLGRAHEVVEADTPLVLTVVGGANPPRWPNAQLLLKYRRARSTFELEKEAQAKGKPVHELKEELAARGLAIETWGVDDICSDLNRTGLTGSPTKVKKIMNVVLKGKDLKLFTPDDHGVKTLVDTLVNERTFG
jgi:electron transfer flavoprotein beta subunit